MEFSISQASAKTITLKVATKLQKYGSLDRLNCRPVDHFWGVRGSAPGLLKRYAELTDDHEINLSRRNHRTLGR